MADLDDLIAEATVPKPHRQCWLCSQPADHPVRDYIHRLRQVHADPDQPRIIFNQVCRVVDREWGLSISPNTVTTLLEGTPKCHTTR